MVDRSGGEGEHCRACLVCRSRSVLCVMLLEVLDRTSYLELWVQYNCLIIIMESELLIYVTSMYYISNHYML